MKVMKSIKIDQNFTNVETESLKHFLKEVSLIPVFKTPEEELEVAIRASNGDEKAKEELIKKNLRFVVSVAKKYVMDGVLLNDLINEGCIGLTKAADRYNPNLGYKFISFAVFWIRKLILAFILENGRTIRIPANKYMELTQLDKNIANLEQKNGEPVDMSQVFNEYSKDMSVKTATSIRDLSFYKVASLDRTVSNSEESTATLIDFIVDDETFPETDHLLHESSLKKQVTSSLKVLNERDRGILILLFGLNNRAPMSLIEVADEVGLSSERVRQIQNKCLVKLKNNKNAISAYTNV